MVVTICPIKWLTERCINNMGNYLQVASLASATPGMAPLDVMGMYDYNNKMHG